MFKNTFVVLVVILLVVVLIFAGPFLIIWSLNTLFPVLAIEYNFWTWCAALILGAVVGPTVRVKRD